MKKGISRGAPLVHRLTRESIQEIYAMQEQGVVYRVIGKKYGISTTAVGRILDKSQWCPTQKLLWRGIVPDQPKKKMPSDMANRSASWPAHQAEYDDVIEAAGVEPDAPYDTEASKALKEEPPVHTDEEIEIHARPLTGEVPELIMDVSEALNIINTVQGTLIDLRERLINLL